MASPGFQEQLRAGCGAGADGGVAHRRHWVEHSHEEAKGPLGWDQDQGRLWRGFIGTR